MKPTTDIVEELRLYNRWRRGDEAITAPDPTALGKLLDDAADRIEHLFASGIHTCHADCQRPMCVLRRERDKAHADLARATADNSSLAERLTAAELERDRLGAELEELQGSHDLNQIASDALNDLRADLARVTAERDNARGNNKLLDNECHALRARVAELESSCRDLRVAYEQNASQCVRLNRELALKSDTVEWLNGVTIQRQRAEQAERRNAEMVAALREVDEIVNDANHSAEDRLCAAANRLLNTRAESATPDHIPDAAKMVSATPAKHCESTPQEQAEAYVALLQSTGMAYEITPHTIAYRSYLDGLAAGAASSPEAKRLNWALDHPEKFHDLASDFMRRYTADAEANARMIADEIDEAMKLDTYP